MVKGVFNTERINQITVVDLYIKTGCSHWRKPYIRLSPYFKSDYLHLLITLDGGSKQLQFCE